MTRARSEVEFIYWLTLVTSMFFGVFLLVLAKIEDRFICFILFIMNYSLHLIYSVVLEVNKF